MKKNNANNNNEVFDIDMQSNRNAAGERPIAAEDGHIRKFRRSQGGMMYDITPQAGPAPTGVLKCRMVLIVAGIFALICGLLLTSYFVVTSFLNSPGHSFGLSDLEVSLNGGTPVFDGTDLNIEPGTILRREFTIENLGASDVYFRIYMTGVSGTLRDVLIFCVYDGEQMLYSGSAAQMTKEHTDRSDSVLASGETRTLVIEAEMPITAGDAYQNGDLLFDLVLDAVQAKNNPDGVFE